MPLVRTSAIILATVRYSESSKIVRLATRDMGVQSAIAKGALRPKSRFGASLQGLSEGQADLLVKEHRELHTLTAFELTRFPIGLAHDLGRYTAAAALAEVMLRFAPAAPHPESFDLLGEALGTLEAAPAVDLPALGCRLLWSLVAALGFAPSLETCVRDGAAVRATGPLAFSLTGGGALCDACATGHATIQLPPDARVDLRALLDAETPLPVLDERHVAAHRRLLSRYIQYHLAEGTKLPALDFWMRKV